MSERFAMGTLTIMKPVNERIKEIEDVVKTDLKKFNVSDFEIKIYNTLKKQGYGSLKQLDVLDNIETKVLGFVNEEKQLNYA